MMTKEPKKPEEIAASRAALVRRAWLERTGTMHGARKALSNLELSLLEHTAALRKLELRTSRFCEDVRRLISNGGNACISEDTTVLAEQLLSGKVLQVIILGQQKLLDAKYRRMNFGMTGNAEDDLVAYKEWDAERAAIDILKRAIVLARKAMVGTNKESMAKFAEAVSSVRTETCREFLAALKLMQDAVQTDQALAEGLDADEVNCLRPKPFPLRILGSESVEWLLDALAAKLIEPAELSGLRLDTVTRAQDGTVSPE